jgi:hypothetical protein
MRRFCGSDVPGFRAMTYGISTRKIGLSLSRLEPLGSVRSPRHSTRPTGARVSPGVSLTPPRLQRRLRRPPHRLRPIQTDFFAPALTGLPTRKAPLSQGFSSSGRRSSGAAPAREPSQDTEPIRGPLDRPGAAPHALDARRLGRRLAQPAAARNRRLAQPLVCPRRAVVLESRRQGPAYDAGRGGPRADG